MRKALDELNNSIEGMIETNKKMSRCAEILTDIIGRGTRGKSDDKFCVTHITKQEVLELTMMGGDDE
jgi:hypothetical protein